MEFHRVLAGVAVGSAGIDGAAGVDDAALLVMEIAQNQLPVGCFPQRITVFAGKHFSADMCAVIAGQADDADGGNDIAGGYGSNGMGHKLSSLFYIKKGQRIAV